MTTLRLAWLFARRSGSDRSTVALPVTAFAVVTALLTVVAGGAQAFFSWTDDRAALYQVLAVIALSLLVAPLLALGGSAARLSARRRDDRLAGLRLLGATPRLVKTLAVVESAALALAGALAGALLAVAVSPLVALIPFRGAPLGPSSLLAAPGIAVTVTAVVALSALSAVVGLRRVILSPLGVRTRRQAPRVHWIRIVVTVLSLGAIVGLMALVQVVPDLGVLLAVLAVAFAGSLAVSHVAGPWLLRVVASRQARRARTARRLLAARSILESPTAAWRQVSGVTMTSFIAVVAGVGLAVMDAAGGAADAGTRQLVADLRTGVIVTLAVSFLMVACSVGVNRAAAILDRRELYVGLDRLGMPAAEMNAARSRAVLAPLRITSIGSAVTAGVVLFPLTGISLLLSPFTLVTIAACIAAGIGLVWLALRTTRPVLARVVAEPSPSL